jgi:hypothetical protein
MKHYLERSDSTMRVTLQLLFLTAVCLLAGGTLAFGLSGHEKIRVILDTDANNELDDQHAIAYLLFNGDVFDVEAITVNRTQGGGGVDQHLAEAQRVVRLCALDSKVPVLRGADKSFEEIKGQLDRPDFDGAEAVNFIIERAKAADAGLCAGWTAGGLRRRARPAGVDLYDGQWPATGPAFRTARRPAETAGADARGRGFL